MATRLYTTNREVDKTLPTVQGTWTASANTNSGQLSTKGGHGAAATGGVAASANGNYMCARFQSLPFMDTVAFTTSHTLQLVTGAVITNTSNTVAVHRIHCFVIAPDGTTVRGTLLGNHTVTGTAWTTTATGRTSTAAVALGANVTALRDDRIVIELGYNRSGTSTAARTGTINYGNTGQIDLISGNTNVTTRPGWIEFSNNFGITSTMDFNNYQHARSVSEGIISIGEKIR